ncbi:MAG: crossover junction endodeoxyribonuclease RuvC [Dehalococcoidia bacterium]
MRILGVDPGLNTTGYGVIEISGGDIRVIEGGVIKGGSAGTRIELRLARLHDGIAEVMEQFKPEAMALEKLYSHYERPSTAILMGHARGVICLAAAQSGVPVCSYGATEIKSYLTGNGRASKVQMQKAIQAHLRLDQVPAPHDVADALAAAVCHYWTVSSPVMDAVGDHQRVGGIRRAK